MRCGYGRSVLAVVVMFLSLSVAPVARIQTLVSHTFFRAALGFGLPACRTVLVLACPSLDILRKQSRVLGWTEQTRHGCPNPSLLAPSPSIGGWGSESSDGHPECCTSEVLRRVATIFLWTCGPGRLRLAGLLRLKLGGGIFFSSTRFLDFICGHSPPRWQDADTGRCAEKPFAGKPGSRARNKSGSFSPPSSPLTGTWPDPLCARPSHPFRGGVRLLLKHVKVEAGGNPCTPRSKRVEPTWLGDGDGARAAASLLGVATFPMECPTRGH